MSDEEFGHYMRERVAAPGVRPLWGAESGYMAVLELPFAHPFSHDPDAAVATLSNLLEDGERLSVEKVPHLNVHRYTVRFIANEERAQHLHVHMSEDALSFAHAWRVQSAKG